MKKIELNNISPRYQQKIVFCSRKEWRNLTQEERKDLLWVNDSDTLPEQISRIAAKIMRDMLEIFRERPSKEGRAKVLDNLLKQVIKEMEIDDKILPKLHGQIYEIYNLSPEFILTIEFNTKEVFRAREKHRSFRGRCKEGGGGNHVDKPLKTSIEISLTDDNGNFFSPRRLIQTLSHETDHLMVEVIAPDYQFVKMRDGKTIYECETLGIMYEDMFLHILETCFVWVK